MNTKLLLSAVLFGYSIFKIADAAEQQIVGRIDKIDPATRTIVVDGKSLVVSPKTKFLIDGVPAKINETHVGKQTQITFDDALDVALVIAIGVIQSNDDAMKAFSGTWRGIAAEEVGRVLTQESVDDEKRNLTCVKHRMRMEKPSKNGPATGWYGLFVVDATTHSFDFVGKDPNGNYVEWAGIYEIDGDLLKLCFRWVRDDKATRPTAFKTDTQKPNISSFYTYRRINESSDLPNGGEQLKD